MSAACEGHVVADEERYDDLLKRYATYPVGLAAELAKKNQERKLMHEMLSAYGIPSKTFAGRDLCLIARLAIALEHI